MRTARWLVTLAIMFCVSFAADGTYIPPVAAQQTAAAARYSHRDVMISMRDGIKLHAQVWRPNDQVKALPILMVRSPYGFDVETLNEALSPGGAYGELAAAQYIFVFQDLRGRFESEGEFVTLRPLKKSPDGVDESTDTFDTIDWLTKNLAKNNGKVGVFGVSYGGWTAALAAINPHPALRAISSQASPEDMFIGDDFLHNGAFRLDYAWSWVSALEADGRTMQPFNFGTNDLYEWYLKQGNLDNLDRQHLGHSIPSWQNFVDHPNYDEFWKRSRTSHMMPPRVAVPNLIVAGWWDQEDFYGPLKIYENQEKGDDRGINHIVIGPWYHGGWRRDAGASYGPYDLGSKTSVWFRAQVELPWFEYWLKDKGTMKQPEAVVFQSGSNQWQSLPSWPPKNALARQLYLHANGKLSFVSPEDAHDTKVDFISDPANPVPFRERQNLGSFLAADSTWKTWMADDQAPFSKRNDVLFWQTEPLSADLVITGKISAKIFASTTGSDADWIVKLIDVYPASVSPAKLAKRQRLIAHEVFRGRFRNSFVKPEAINPGVVIRYDVGLHSASHVFKKGHRVAIQVQSSWFPLIDRNPQTFVDNILRAQATDFRAQTHSIHQSRRYPSSISLEVPN
jgi:putative CocE/NonD family hydrolase